MSLLKSFGGALDHQVASFTKILQRRRGLQIGPDGSGQGLLYRIGMSGAGHALSPEAAIARALKEWVGLQRHPLDTQLSILESLVMGNRYVAPNEITSLEQWFAWRLPLAFPSHRFDSFDGWNLDFYTWAIQRAREHFV